MVQGSCLYVHGDAADAPTRTELLDIDRATPCLTDLAAASDPKETRR